MMRTRLVLMTFLVMGAPGVARAGVVPGFGVKAGAVAATQNWNYAEGFDLGAKLRWGWDVAVFKEFLKVGPLGFLAEIHYIQKGFREEECRTLPFGPPCQGFVSSRPRVDYISIPLLAKVRFGAGGVVPYVLAGPRWDFLVDRSGQNMHEVIDQMKRFDFGVSVGAGVETGLPLGGPGVLAEVRYSPSLIHAFDNGTLTVTNQAIEFLVGVRL
jgi:hypothetical protein